MLTGLITVGTGNDFVVCEPITYDDQRRKWADLMDQEPLSIQALTRLNKLLAGRATSQELNYPQMQSHALG